MRYRFSTILACAIAFVVIGCSLQSKPKSVKDFVQNYYNADQKLFDDGIELVDVEIVKSWATVPKDIAIVRTYSEFVRSSAPNRVRHELLVIEKNSGVLGVVDGFTSAPTVVRVHDKFLRIDNFPILPFETTRDALRLAAIGNVGDWVLKSDYAYYARKASELLLEYYIDSGRDAVSVATLQSIVGTKWVTSSRSPCWTNGIYGNGVILDTDLPELISNYIIDEAIMYNISEANFIYSNTWEVTLDVKLVALDNNIAHAKIVVVSDPCDRDRISLVSVNAVDPP